jgi:serine protease DegQ
MDHARVVRMKRSPLYGSSRSLRRRAKTPESGWTRPPEGEGPELTPEKTLRRRIAERWLPFQVRFDRPINIVAGVALTLAILFGFQALQPKPKVFTQRDIDAAVAYSLKTRPDPSPAAVAAAIVRPSVVRVTGYDPDRVVGATTEPSAFESPHANAVSVGTGVIIDERGTILTNLHVVVSAPRLKVTFADGTESDADITGAQPENDLAVIRPHRLPDDMTPATLASTRGLAPGDEVVAVGFPFGVGPSVSSGVVSGLNRAWRFQGAEPARNLIQFDAAANPGNSGGPLINRQGEVLGIVTGILNPNNQGVFIGIAFAVPIENAAQAVGRSPF